jgi:hypothetical protein
MVVEAFSTATPDDCKCATMYVRNQDIEECWKRDWLIDDEVEGMLITVMVKF